MLSKPIRDKADPRGRFARALMGRKFVTARSRNEPLQCGQPFARYATSNANFREVQVDVKSRSIYLYEQNPPCDVLHLSNALLTIRINGSPVL